MTVEAFSLSALLHCLHMKCVNISMLRPHLHDVPEPHPLQGCTLRPLKREDEPQLASLLSLVFEEAWDERRVASTLTRAADVRAVYGIVQHGELVATASSQVRPERDPAAGFIHWVATHPGHRSRGLAAALLVRLLEDFSARKYTCARLVTQPERIPAIKLYLSFGFIPRYEVGGTDHQKIWSGIFQALYAGRTAAQSYLAEPPPSS